MKKILNIILILVLIIVLNTVSFASINYIIDNKVNSYKGKDVTIKLDNETIKTDIAPIIHNDRTLIPIRAVVEKLGGNIQWDNDERKVSIKLDDTNIEMIIDDNVAKVNNKEVKLDVPACIAYSGNDQETGRTVVPIRFVMENLGLDVSWDQDTYTVLIKSKNDEKDEDEDEENKTTNSITNVQYEVNDTNIIVRITTEEEMKYSISDLKDSYRTLVKIENADVSFTKNQINVDTGNIDKIRLGVNEGYSSIVVDLYNQEKYTTSINSSKTILTIKYEYEQKQIDKISVNTSSKSKAIVNIEGNNISKYDIRRLTNPERVQLTIYDMDVKTKDVLKNEKISNKYINKISSNDNDENIQIVIYLNEQYQYSFSKTSSKGVIEVFESNIENTEYYNDERYGLLIDLDKNITDSKIEYNHDRGMNTFTLKIPTSYGNLGEGDLKVGDKYVEKINIKEDDDEYIITMKLYIACDISVECDKKQISVRILKRDPSKSIIIVVDPGHVGKGGVGASYGGVIERTINTSVAKKLIKMLEELDGVEVYTTMGLNYVELYEATGYANDIGADLFISIHCNAAVSATGQPLESAVGTETYYALKEGDSAYGITSQKLADYVQKGLIKNLGSKDRGVIRRDTLAVLRTSKMPAMLTELGFMSSTKELENLTDDKYQQKCAQGIYEGIVNAIEYMKN